MISEKNDRVVGSSSSSKPDGQMRYKSNETIKEVKALTFGMPITQGRVSHVCKFDVAF